MKNRLTLYHSTTDLYLDSIRQRGLGGSNPNQENGVLKFLQELFALSEKYLFDNKKYQEVQYTTDGMAKQCIKGVFNFKHDKTYLSILESTAIRYSLNKYGSELLSRCILLYDLLCEYGVSSEINTSTLNFNIQELKNKEMQNIMLKVKDIDISDLETETGECAIEKINEMEGLKRSCREAYEALSQQMNFALRKPIDYKSIEVYKIKINQINGFEIDYKLENYVG